MRHSCSSDCKAAETQQRVRCLQKSWWEDERRERREHPLERSSQRRVKEAWKGYPQLPHPLKMLVHREAQWRHERTDCCILPMSGTNSTSAAAAQSYINTEDNSALLELLLTPPTLTVSSPAQLHMHAGHWEQELRQVKHSCCTSLLCEHPPVSWACLERGLPLAMVWHHRPCSAGLQYHLISSHGLKLTLGKRASIAATVYNPVSKNAQARCAGASLTPHPPTYRTQLSAHVQHSILCALLPSHFYFTQMKNKNPLLSKSLENFYEIVMLPIYVEKAPNPQAVCRCSSQGRGRCCWHSAAQAIREGNATLDGVLSKRNGKDFLLFRA